MSVCILNKVEFDPKELSADQFLQIAETIRQDDQPLGSVDFNKIIPAPSELDIEAGTRTYQGLALHQKYQRACARLSKAKKSVPESYPRLKEEHDKKWTVVQGQDIDTWNLGAQAYQNKKKHGYPTQVEWNSVYWGTHRNAFDCQPVQNGSMAFVFYTSGVPVPNILLHLSAQYPELTITYQWASTEIGKEVGEYVLKDGDIIDANIPVPKSREAYRMAACILGDDPDIYQGGETLNKTQKEVLRERLKQSYAAYMESLQGKSAAELIAMAPEITAARQCSEDLLNACDPDDVAFLLQFDDPLEIVRGYWEAELTGYDHSGEMGHMLWEIRDRELYPKGAISPSTAKAEQNKVKRASVKKERDER